MDVRNLIAAATLLAATAMPLTAVSAKKVAPSAGSEKACMTRPQLEALITYALPSIIDQVSRVCAGTLGPDTFLRASGGQLATRYRADNEQYWPVARGAVTAMTGQDISGLGEDTEKAMVTSIVGIGVASAIKPKDCNDVNEVVELLSPLPAANLGKLTAMLAIIGSKNDKPGSSAFSICPVAGGQ